MTHSRKKTGASFEAKDSGHTIARVGLSLTFFMERWRGSEANIAAAYRKIKPLLDADARWYRTGSMRSMGKVKKGVLDGPLVIEQSPPPKGAAFSLTLTSGATADDVGPVTFYMSLVDSAKDKEASVFHLAVPLAWAQKPEALQGLFLELAALLPFRSGLGGYATQVDEGEADPTADEACRAWLRRYRGIDSMHAIVITEYVLTKAKGINWLTAIDSVVAAKLGGAAKLGKRLHPPIAVHAVGGGLVIQAGAQPLLLDAYSSEDASLYRTVDAAIRPARLTGGPVLPGFEDEDETAEWMARFE